MSMRHDNSVSSKITNENASVSDVDMSKLRDYELIIQELQVRIGQLVSTYELQLASLRVDATKEIEARDAKIAALHARLAPEPDDA